VKKFFKIYTELYYIMEHLSLEQKGELFDACFKYNIGEDVEIKDELVKMAFVIFKPPFDGENVSWLPYYNPNKRWSYDYKKWRDSVLKRDKNMCQNCGSKDKLHAHHICPYESFPELRLNLDNGQTLCAKCHIQEHILLRQE